jgi:hypothetical protein
MFQKKGHALQDFAKLEAEIKFTLMDRQKGSAAGKPPAYDFTYSQLPLWRSLEDHLLNDGWDAKKSDWSKNRHKDNVMFCLELVQLVRDKAAAVQQQTIDSAPQPNLTFLEEYFPALLFHTLKAIGYDSLSVFKRLLAVYSASCLLKKLGVVMTNLH